MKNKKSAFTLIELMTVQICIMILAMIAWNNYHQYVYRAKTAEAFVVLGNMERQLRTYYYENGSFITTTPNPAAAPGISAPGTQSAFGASENWQALGMPVVPGEQVFFSYQVFAGQSETTSTNPVVSATLHAPTDDMDLVRSGLYTASNAPAALPTSYTLHAKDFNLDFGIFSCDAMAGEFDQNACMRACKEDQSCIDKCKPPSDNSTCEEQCRGDQRCIDQCKGAGDGKDPGHGHPGHNCSSSCPGNPGHGQPGHNCHSSCPGNPPHGHDGHHCNGNDDGEQSCEQRCRGNMECIQRCGGGGEPTCEESCNGDLACIDNCNGGGEPPPEPTCEESCNGDQTCLRNSCGIGVGIDPPGEPTCEEQWALSCEGSQDCLDQHCGGGEPTGGGNPGIQSCDPFTVSKPIDFGVRQNVGGYKWAIINAVGHAETDDDKKCTLKAKVIQVFDGDPKATGFISFDERE